MIWAVEAGGERGEKSFFISRPGGIGDSFSSFPSGLSAYLFILDVIWGIGDAKANLFPQATFETITNLPKRTGVSELTKKQRHKAAPIAEAILVII